MRTVQEVLKDMDTEELVYSYLERITLYYKRLEQSEDISAKEFVERAKSKIRNFIEYMRTIPVVKADEDYVLFAFEHVTDIITEYSASLARMNELSGNIEDVQSYAYEFTPHNEIAGFYVSDTKRTQKHLLELMTDVLFEATFFGFSPDDVEEKRKEIDDSLKESELSMEKAIPAEKAFADLFEKFGIEKENISGEEKSAENAYHMARIQYDRVLYLKALKEVIDNLNK